MAMLDNPVTGPLERYLDLLAKRHELIVSNMANVDTPHYRTRDIDFQGELRRASSSLEESDPQPRVVEVPGLVERPDGNNVSMDREGMLLAQTQLEFKMGTALLKHTFQGLMSVIKEGGTNT